MKSDAGTPRRGRIFDLQRFSVHDGPGVRTTVFLSGCPLRCAWCHNPECFDPSQGQWQSAEDVMREVRKDAHYARVSGGGLTISGGEPLLQLDFVRALLTLAGEERLHRCVQTCGDVPGASLEAILGDVELIQFDLKHPDPEAHRSLTGRGNATIFDNARLLVRKGAPVEFRMPLVPGANDSEDVLKHAASAFAELGVTSLTLLPYQNLYLDKYTRLRMPARFLDATPPDAATMRAAAEIFSRAGVHAAPSR